MTVPGFPRVLRKPARWLRRCYLLACARDDARGRGYRVPEGVWACADCGFVSLDALGFRRHMLLTHAV